MIKKILGWVVLGSLIFGGIYYCRLPDINTCSYNELISIKGIGEVKAMEIIQNRPYNSFNDLKKLKNIGEKTLKNLKKNSKIKQVE